MRAIKKVFGFNLCSYLARRHMTVSELADAVGVHKVQVYRYISGEAWPSSERMDLICEILEIKPHVLFKDRFSA